MATTGTSAGVVVPVMGPATGFTAMVTVAGADP